MMSKNAGEDGCHEVSFFGNEQRMMFKKCKRRRSEQFDETRVFLANSDFGFCALS